MGIERRAPGALESEASFQFLAHGVGACRKSPVHPHAPFGVLLFRPSASADDEFTVQPFDDVALRGGQRVAGYLDRPGARFGRASAI